VRLDLPGTAERDALLVDPAGAGEDLAAAVRPAVDPVPPGAHDHHEELSTGLKGLDRGLGRLAGERRGPGQ
jgi:hypothetical protein